MFALQYQDGFLDLAEGENPLTRWVSTAFNDSDKLLGSGSELSFELADTPANYAKLGYANQLANRLARNDIEVVIWLFGMPWKRCTFSFNLKDGRISGYTKIDNGEFADIIKEKTLPQVFIKTKNGSFDDHDWIFVGNDLAGTVAAVNNSLIPGASPYTFYPFINTTLLGDYSGGDAVQIWEQPRIINRWRNDGFRMTGTGEAALKSSWYCPALSFVWVIKKVCTYLGYEAIGNMFDDEFINSLMIDNNSIYNESDIFKADGWKLAPALHLPSVKLNDFFKYCREYFGIIYYFNSDTKEAHFALSETVLNSQDRVDLDGCIESGRPTTQKTTETGYEVVQGIDPDDKLFEIYPYVKSFFIGGSKVRKKVEAPIATCFMSKEANIDRTGNPVWRIPVKRQIGNAFSDLAVDSPAHNPEDFGRNKFALRLVSYRGMVNDASGSPYPYAASDGLAPDGVTEICPSVWLSGTNGILERYRRKWYTFLIRTELVVLRSLLTNQLLSLLSPLNKIRFPTEQGNYVEAFMDQIKFTPTNDRFLRADISVYPNYNLSAADEAINTDFVSGEIVNQQVVYVWLVENNLERVYKRPFLGARTLRLIYADIFAYFYSDPEGTIPVVVDGLEISVVNEKVTNGVYTPLPLQFTCYGDNQQLRTGVNLWYHKGSTHYTQKFVLANGPGYLRIT